LSQNRGKPESRPEHEPPGKALQRTGYVTGNSVLRIHERKPCDPEGDATIIALKTPDLHGDL